MRSTTVDRLTDALLPLADEIDQDEGPVILAWCVPNLARALAKQLDARDLRLITDDDVPYHLIVPWWQLLSWWVRPYWHRTDTRVWRWQRKPCRVLVLDPNDAQEG